MKRRKRNNEYYCTGICETCEKGKLYNDEDGEYYTCDEEKVKGLIIKPPVPNFKQEKSIT